MKLVIIESPYKGHNWEETEENIRFARLCMRDCLKRGMAPYASHLLYTQEGVLDDKVPEERMFGIESGFAWKEAADKTEIFINRGISRGMNLGVRKSIALGQEFEYRVLPDYPKRFPNSRIITLTGASGAGKTTLLKKLLAEKPNMKFVRSFTSRSARPSDLPGEYRYNVPKEKFEEERARFLWVMPAHNNLYGTHKQSLSAAFSRHDASTAPRVMVLIPEAVATLRGHLAARPTHYEELLLSFYLLAPDELELTKRLVARGDDAETVKKRISDCRKWDEEALASNIPYIFLRNDDLLTRDDNIAQQFQQISLFL